MKFERLAELRRDLEKPSWTWPDGSKCHEVTISMIGKITKEYGQIGHVVQVTKAPDEYDIRGLQAVHVILATRKFGPSEKEWIKAICQQEPHSLVVWRADQGRFYYWLTTLERAGKQELSENCLELGYAPRQLNYLVEKTKRTIQAARRGTARG